MKQPSHRHGNYRAVVLSKNELSIIKHIDMKNLKLKWFLSLIFILGSALPAAANVEIDGIVYSISRSTATALEYTGSSEEVQIPEQFVRNGNTYTVTIVGSAGGSRISGLADYPIPGFVAPAVKKLVLPSSVTFAYLSSQSPLIEEVETSSAETAIRIQNIELGTLTIKGYGCTLNLGINSREEDQGPTSVDNLVFDCQKAILTRFSDDTYWEYYSVKKATLTDKVTNVGGRFDIADEIEVANEEFDGVADYAFANCALERFKVNSTTSAHVLQNAKIGRLDISERIDYELNMKSVGTLFVGDDVETYNLVGTTRPGKIEGAALRTVTYPTRMSLANTTWYDFDGDGSLSFVTSGGGYYNNELQPLGMAEPVDDNYRIKGIYRALDSDNSGVPTLFINDKSAFKYDPETDGFNKAELPEGYLLLDADNNGLTDILTAEDADLFINYRQTDGDYLKTKLRFTTNREDVYNATYELSGNWGDNIPSLSDGWMINGSSIPDSYINITLAADLNKDGIPDLVDNNVGGILYNIGGNDYYTSPEKGEIHQCDLNDDGVLDYVLFDDDESKVYLMIYQSDGSYSQQLLIENSSVSNVWCKDFDHDGDIDVALTVDNESGNNTFSFIAFFRNDGGGKFTRKENSFTEEYEFVGCNDVNADGLYEFIATDGGNRQTVLLGCDGNLKVTEAEVLHDSYLYPGSGSNADGYVAGDMDNDGFVEYLYSRGNEIGKILNFGDRKNTAPEKMAAPVAYYDEASGKLRITWEEGNDAETSTCDLTYELRIGTAPGKADILATNSLADGRRRTLEEGNMGRNLYNLFNPSAMAEGTYYIAVQAIDAGGLGGAWSDDAVYQHKKAAADFSISHSEMTTADTLQLAARKIDGATYKWDIADGTVIGGEGNRIDVTFGSYGEREIGLAITLADGSTLTADTKTVDVLMFSIGSSYDFVPEDIYYDWDHAGFADFNGDGYVDAIVSSFAASAHKGMWSNDGDGTFSKVGKLFNTDLSESPYGILDFNKDGYLDFMSDEEKGNVFINSGFDDFSFEYSTKELMMINADRNIPRGLLLGDMNNDGYPEWFYDTSHTANPSYLNGGDNLTFTQVESFEIPDKENPEKTVRLDAEYYYDINRDGFIDAIASERDSDNDIWTMYALLKDPTGDFSFEDEKPMFEVSFDSWNFPALFGDLNSDGYLDLFYRKSGENFIRVIPGKPESEWPCKEEVRIPLVGDYNFSLLSSKDDYFRLYDFDNNGYPDIPIKAEDPAGTDAMPSYAILLMQPDFKAELCRINGVGNDASPFIALSDGAYPQIGGSYKTLGRSDNQAPERPSGVMAKQTADGMLITWSDAKDDHTPAVQMQYNVSVKKKGATGENSFVISPMNALSDEAAVVPGYMYKKSTRMTVPSEFLEAGQTYEVQIQAIDAFNEHSPMTEPVEITISAAGYIDAADKVAKGAETTLKYVGTQASSFSYELDGGTLVTDKGNGEITAKWDEPGVKQITLTASGITINSAITVVDLLDVDFTLPENPLAGAPIEVEVPEAMLDNSRESGFRCDDERVTIEWNRGDEIAVITFAETGTYTVESYIEDDIQGNTCRREAVVAEAMPLAEIAGVTADAAGHYTVSWNTAGMPQQVGKVVISKETNRVDKYSVIGEADLSEGAFTDPESDPAVKSERYIINLAADNGQKSYASDPHKPLHVMINLAAAGGYNLMWNSYEGMEVDYYTIMRGPSADNLTELTQIAGSQQNYTDMNAPQGEMFYAVTFTPTAAEMLRGKAAGRTSVAVSSNVVSTSEAIAATYATSMQILSVEPEMRLTYEQGALHLFTEMQPLSATFNRVSWEIVEGDGLATIDANGLLTATGEGSGNVVVRATALDGSGLTAKATIVCEEGAGGVTELRDYNDGEWQLRVANNRGNLRLSGWNDGDEATLYIVSMQGQVMEIVRTSDPQAEIDCAGYPGGVYVVKAIAGGEAKAVKFAL